MALVGEIGGDGPWSLALGRLDFLAFEQWQSKPSLQRQTRAAREQIKLRKREGIPEGDTHLSDLLEG
jgi:hypothetical protein